MTITPNTAFRVAVVRQNELGDTHVFLGAWPADCCKAILEWLTDEVNDHNAEMREQGEPIGSDFYMALPVWDETDADWDRICQEHDITVTFHCKTTDEIEGL